VQHHVALSVVGTDRLAESACLRGKIAQEALVHGAGIPYGIAHSTQFFEFLGAIAQSGAARGRAPRRARLRGLVRVAQATASSMALRRAGQPAGSNGTQPGCAATRAVQRRIAPKRAMS